MMAASAEDWAVRRSDWRREILRFKVVGSPSVDLEASVEGAASDDLRFCTSSRAADVAVSAAVALCSRLCTVDSCVLLLDSRMLS